jgi:phosphoribosyl-ATP pyrophosphohydrolase/phosphoribosyl-AMP cyclohydrolase
MNKTDLKFLGELEHIIRDRISRKPDASYTANLISSGMRRVAQKVGEEAVELALAAVDGSRDEQINEAADLVFHLQVLLAVLDLSLQDVACCLERRHVS